VARMRGWAADPKSDGRARSIYNPAAPPLRPEIADAIVGPDAFESESDKRIENCRESSVERGAITKTCASKQTPTEALRRTAMCYAIGR